MSYPINLAPRGNTVDEYKKSDGTVQKIADPYRFFEDPESQ
jgi:hypothetical protein